MYVDEILKRVVKRKDEEKTDTFILGVECHWMDAEGEYGNGRFLTMELRPWLSKEAIENHESLNNLYDSGLQ